MAKCLILFIVLIYVQFDLTQNKSDHSEIIPGTEACGITGGWNFPLSAIAVWYEYPWLAILLYNGSTVYESNCGGVLINNRHVLTAAQCVVKHSLRQDLIGVRLGEFQLSTNPDCDELIPNPNDCLDEPIDVEIEAVTVHPQYDLETLANDIALIRLAGEITYTDTIRPICLPTEDKFPYIHFIGFDVEVCGWNVDYPDFTRKFDLPLKSKAVVITNTQCKQIYQSSIVVISNSSICTGGHLETNICRGNVGGPLMFYDGNTDRYFTLGVSSFIPYPCDVEKETAVFTRTTQYLSWIFENVKP